MAEFLLELFCEEIPAGYQAAAAADLARRLDAGLAAARLAHGPVLSGVTPRRLWAVVADVAEGQPDLREERRGPRADAPDKAVAGFLKANGLEREQVETRETERGAFLFAVIEQAGKPSVDLLPAIVQQVVESLSWPKSMRWSDNRLRWVRPLRSVLALFAGQVLPGGLDLSPGVLTFGNATAGHRFLAPEPFRVRDFAEYRDRLRAAYVMIDAAERAETIREDAQRLAASQDLSVVADDALVREVAGLVEWPVVLLASFDRDYLNLPPEVLTTTMRKNQRYFALTDSTGALAPRFALVANLLADDGGTAIVAGNERVLRARLADARFFWDQDRRRSLASRVADLSGMVFHARLGHLRQKADRMAALAADLARVIPGADIELASTAARLAKADLGTGMVAEFPELQGVMGRYYAEQDSEASEVALAIRDHYRPAGPSDSCPSAPLSVCVALADKIDTLVGFFAIGETPTGSRDPFALRRAALGVIRLILENGIRLPLVPVFGQAAALYGRTVDGFDGADPTAILLPFVAERLKVHLRESGIRHDLVTATFAERLGRPDDDLVRLVARTSALALFLETEDGANLLTAYRRAANIVRAETHKGWVETGTPDDALLSQKEEIRLAAVLHELAGVSGKALDGADLKSYFTALAALRQPVDAFFDNVTVNSDDQHLRHNRLLLLMALCRCMETVADFSCIEG